MGYKKIILLISILSGVYWNVSKVSGAALEPAPEVNTSKSALKSRSDQSSGVSTLVMVVERSPVVQRDSEYFSFKPSLEARQRYLRQFVERIRQQDPESAKSLERLIVEHDVIEDLQKNLSTYGLVVNNLVDAYTVWWVSAWFAAQGKLLSLDYQTAQAVKKQATEALINSKAFDKTSDLMKQELAETLFMQAILLEAAVEQAKADPLALYQLSESVKADAKKAGLALETMSLTPQGFIPSH